MSSGLAKKYGIIFGKNFSENFMMVLKGSIVRSMTAFFPGSLGDVREGDIFEDVRDRVSHLEHDVAEAAFFLLGAPDIRPFADAVQRGERAVYDPYDFRHADFGWILDQLVSASEAWLARKKSGLFQFEEYLFEELDRDFLGFCDLVYCDRPVVVEREIYHRHQGVFAFFGYFHIFRFLRSSDIC